jgi:hypothetical protein
MKRQATINNPFIHSKLPTDDNTKGEWLSKHKIKQDRNGYFLFYIAVPSTLDVETIVKDTRLENNKQDALHYAQHEGIENPKIVAIKVKPNEINCGVFATINTAVDVNR